MNISNEPLHKPINLQFVVFFWNNFNRKDQWDVGTRIYNSRTDHAEIAIRFPQWKPVTGVKFETRSPIGDKSQTQSITPDPAGWCTTRINKAMFLVLPGRFRSLRMIKRIG